MLNIAIIPGTSRPQALNPQIVNWVEQQLASNGDVRAEVVDFGSFDLPLLDEVVPAGAKAFNFRI